jgi:hypothetical protein
LVEILSPSIFNQDPEKRQGITFSCDNTAAQPATGAALQCSSSAKPGKEFSKKLKQGPTAENVEDALLGGFPADEMDEEASSFKCLLEDRAQLEFDCNPEPISQLENIPFETPETGTRKT